MNRRSKFLIWVTLVLCLFTIAATYYNTVMLENFDLAGIWLEFTDEGTVYGNFFYNNTEYEIESTDTTLQSVLTAIQEETGAEALSDSDFTSAIEEAYSLALEEEEIQ